MRRNQGVESLICLILVIGLPMISAGTAVSAPLGPSHATGGAPGGGNEGDSDPLAPIKIATGPDNTVDGYLEVSPDEYGSFGSFGIINGITEDRFLPSGQFLQLTTFTSGLFLFVDSSQRELLSDIQEWQDILAPDASLSRAVIAANVPSDTDGDAVDDTLTSSFEVVGGGTALIFDLVQSVSPAGTGVAVLRQDYGITNIGATAVRMVLVRSYDGDLLWSGDFANDEVGTTMHGAGQGTYVVQQEDSDPGVTAVTLSGDEARNYYGCKNGVQPDDGPPPCAFGTDVTVWDAFGMPATWENFIAGVGYLTNGESGVAPPGSVDPADAAVGLDWEISLEPGASTTVTMLHTYGQATPPDGCVLDAVVKGRARAGDSLPVSLTVQHNRPQTITAPFWIWIEDGEGNIVASTKTDPIIMNFGDRVERTYRIVLPSRMPSGVYQLMVSIREMQQGDAILRRSIRVR